MLQLHHNHFLSTRKFLHKIRVRNVKIIWSKIKLIDKLSKISNLQFYCIFTVSKYMFTILSILYQNTKVQITASKYMFKLLYNSGPKNDMQLLSEIHTHNTRQSKNKNVFVSNLLSSNLSKSVTISCSKIWNNLPNNIKAEERPKSFNKLVYDHLLNHYRT